MPLYKTSSGRGFTLIELLVVISIIALLSSVVLASLNSARIKGRDSIRRQSLIQLRTALELYRSVNNSYPNNSYPTASYWTYYTSGCNSIAAGVPSTLLPDNIIPGLRPTFISEIAKDPQKPNPCYLYASDGNDYKFIMFRVVENSITPSDFFYDEASDGDVLNTISIFSPGAKHWNIVDFMF